MLRNINQWSLVRTVDPVDEPLDIADVRLHARIDLHADDVEVRAYIQAARHFAEIYQNRQLMPATYQLTVDWFPSWTLKLPMSPLQSVSSIVYLDTDGASQTLASTEYLVDTFSSPGRITPAYSKIWPITRIQIAAVKVTYIAGYTAANKIPPTTLQAMRLLISHWYEHRADTEESKLNNIPMGATTLLDSERLMDFSGALGSSNNVPGAVLAWGGHGWSY